MLNTILDLVGTSTVCMPFLWSWELPDCLPPSPAQGLSLRIWSTAPSAHAQQIPMFSLWSCCFWGVLFTTQHTNPPVLRSHQFICGVDTFSGLSGLLSTCSLSPRPSDFSHLMYPSPEEMGIRKQNKTKQKLSSWTWQKVKYGGYWRKYQEKILINISQIFSNTSRNSKRRKLNFKGQMYMYYVSAIFYRSHIVSLTQMKPPTISKMYESNFICGLVKSSHMKTIVFKFLFLCFIKERETVRGRDTDWKRERETHDYSRTINLFHAAAISQLSTVWSHCFILQWVSLLSFVF